MYERILLPTDGSPAMWSAIEQCFHQAELSDATVHALYVVDVRSYVMLPEETGNRVADLLDADGRAALESIAERAASRDIQVVTEIAVGVPHDVILGYAAEHDVDLIVMGTHGRSGEEKRIVGSVAEEVVRLADVPVLTVRMSETEHRAVDDAVPDEQQRYIG